MLKRPALVTWCWLAAIPVASAADLDMASIEAGADALTQRSSTLRRQVDPSATGDALDAKSRYDDAMFAFLTRNWNEASRRFWLLRESGLEQDPVMQTDVSWYLAQALARAGMPDLAIEVLDAMADDGKHPYHTGAVRELLDLYVQLGMADEFDRLYKREVVSGNIAITDGTRFDVGRVLMRQGDLDGAASYLEQIAPESWYWYRATYHLGAMAVQKGTVEDLDRAMALFRSITDASAEAPPTAANDQTVVDLAWLGQARVHQARDQLQDALTAYAGVRDDSSYRVQQLHEMVWTFARVERWKQAEYAVDLFVMSFPDHPWAAEMRLTRGHLAYREGREEEAMMKYTEVVEALDPVSERFAELLESRTETGRTLESLAADEQAEITVLPPYAVTIVRRDGDFNRAVGVFSELQADDEELTEAEASKQRLEDALGAGSASGSGDDVLPVRRGVVESLLDAVGLRVDALKAEASWLRSLAGSSPSNLADLEGQASRIAEQLAEVRRDVGTLDSAADVAAAEGVVFTKVPTLDGALRTLAQAQRVIRAGLGVDLQFDPASARVDGMHNRLDALVDLLGKLGERTPKMTQSAVADLVATFREEARRVRLARRDWVSLSSDAREVGIDAGQAAFARAKDEVDETIMGAEMGIVNIYWSRWVASGEEAERVKNERAALLDALEERYDLIRQTLGQ